MGTRYNPESKTALTRAELTEFAVSRLAKKHPELVREKWDFSKCPDEELMECWFYEFRCESPYARQEIASWRQTCNAGTFDKLLYLARGTLTWAKYGQQFYALCPEWPDAPYLSISPAERKRRLKLLFPDETESRAAELKFPLAVPGELSRAEVDFILELLGEREPVESFPLLSDWQHKSDREVLREVARWLKNNRKGNPKPNVSRRYLCADLKALGSYRILKATGGDWRNAPEIYWDQREWMKAYARVKRLIERIDTLNRL
jgi:hypothetical protein